MKTRPWLVRLRQWHAALSVFFLFLCIIVYRASGRYPLRNTSLFVNGNRLHGLKLRSKLPRIQYGFPPENAIYKAERLHRQQAVRNAMEHAWKGYTEYAFGQDEIMPVSGRYTNPFGGWGATLVDSLSTLLVMGMQKEFDASVPQVSHIDFKRTYKGREISTFETIIRYLGGLLSAYELSGNPVMLTKAEELGRVLLPAFETKWGWPMPHFDVVRAWQPSAAMEEAMSTEDTANSRGRSIFKKPFTLRSVYVAEIGTLQLEFMRLSQLTGDPVWAWKANNITDQLESKGDKDQLRIPGLYPTILNATGKFMNDICTFGGLADSMYEYFLKEYIMFDGEVKQYGRMYKESVEGLKNYMLRVVPDTEFLYLSKLNTRSRTFDFLQEHLACFVPGMMAIGSKIFNQPEDLEIAKGLTETCAMSYMVTKTGLSPESWRFTGTIPYNKRTYDANAGGNTTVSKNLEAFKRSFLPHELRYILRPETVESIFILYRITGNKKYREYGWEIFQAIEKWCKTKYAYSAIKDVTASNVTYPASMHTDSMESFFLAETLKYLYLLFSEPDVISLDKFIFNTEAHPLLRSERYHVPPIPLS